MLVASPPRSRLACALLALAILAPSCALSPQRQSTHVQESGATAADPRPAVANPRTARIAIEGDGSDWGQAGLRVDAFAEDRPDPLPTDLLSAHLRLAWTDAGLAARIDLASSAAWVEAEAPRDAYEKDSIELFLRRGSQWRDLVQVVIAPGMAPGRQQPTSYIWDHRGPPGQWAGVPTSAAIARSRVADGCRIAALIPWSQLRIVPAPGLEVEFRCNLNKVLPGIGRCQFVWRSADGNEFQRLVLGEIPTSLPPIAAWAVSSGAGGLAACAIADATRAGSLLTVERAGIVLASARLEAHDGRAQAALTLAAVAPGPIRLALDGVAVGGARIEDASKEAYRNLERAATFGWHGGGWSAHAGSPSSRVTPHVPAILASGALPQPVIDDLGSARLGGLARCDVDWYDADGRSAASATTPGRYGAVIGMHLADGRTLQVYQSAVLLPSMPSDATLGAALAQAYAPSPEGAQAMDPQLAQAIATIGRDAAPSCDDPDLADVLAAEMESRRDGLPARPKARAEAWWQALRKRLGTATVYPLARRYPPGYGLDAGRRWGAIIFLHGKGGDIPSDYAAMANRLRDAPDHDLLGWIKVHPQPFVVYEPLASQWWQTPAVADIVGRILAEDRIDPDQVILMGFSMGGISAWACAVDYPDLWAAVVPIAGGGSQAPEMARAKGIPAWLFNGDIDGLTPLSDAQAAEAALKAVGGDARLTVFHGVDHLGSQQAAFSTPELWTWLARQRRKR